MARNNKKKQRNKKNKNSTSSSQVDLNSASTSQVELNEPIIDENTVIEDVNSPIDTPEPEKIVNDTEKELDLNEEPDLNDKPNDTDDVKPDEAEIKDDEVSNIEKEETPVETSISETPAESTLDGTVVPEEQLNETPEEKRVEEEVETAPEQQPEEDVKEEMKPALEEAQIESTEPETETPVTTEKVPDEVEETELHESEKIPEPLTKQEEIVPETITENEISGGLPIETEDPNGNQLVDEKNSTLERELSNTFPEEEPQLNVTEDASNDNGAESIDDDTIDQPKQIDETESTITSSVPALPPRRSEPLNTTEELPNENNVGGVPPPLPVRSPSMEHNAAYIADSTPLNQHSMILNRLDLTIKNLKDEDNFIPKPEQITEENITTDAESVWAKIIEDPVTNINQFADTLEVELTKGIDPTLRPQLWNSFTLSYCKDWEPIYKVLAGKPSIENKETLIEQIKTYEELQQTDVDAIYNVLSALVALDSSIQPTENSLALAVSIYNVYQNELDSFRIMLILLKSYDGVALYYENSDALSMLLYQFDRLMEEDCHDLYTHLIKKGLRSSMFATDWFLSSFSKILPLESSPQILDVVILEGIPSLLKFALSLMMKNEETLLTLDEFDDLFFYCKNRLFEPYLKGNSEQNTGEDSIDDSSSVDHKKLTVLTKDNFDVSQFVKDAFEQTRINPELLKRYSDEYIEIHRNELAQEEQFQQMRDENTKLQNEVKELEKDYTSLNREHVTIANELLQNHIKIEGVMEANTKMKMEILQLRKQLDTEIKKNNSNSSVLVPNDIQSDLDKTLKKNSKVMQENLIYQDRITSLENTISAIKRATAEGIDYDVENGISSGAFKSPILSGGWTGFKKVFK